MKSYKPKTYSGFFELQNKILLNEKELINKNELIQNVIILTKKYETIL